MTIYSRECLGNPEAVRFASQLYAELLGAEATLDAAELAEETAYSRYREVSAKYRQECKEEFPDFTVVRGDTLHAYLIRAALAGAGYVNAEDIPEEIDDQIVTNMDYFYTDIADLYDRCPQDKQLTGFSFGFHVLQPEAIKEMLAHHFLIVGKLSRNEVDQTAARGDT